MVMHPLDLVKVRFQLGEVPRARFGMALYNTLADAVRADGWKGLYRGLVPNLVGGAGSWGSYFLL
jgi:solute carrier family 25 folate transporter 32